MTKTGKITPLDLIKHPIDTMETFKYERNGSYLIGVIILAVYFLSDVLKKTGTGFIFNVSKIENFNIFHSFYATAAIVLLFILANWCFTTLTDGEGKIGDIFIVVTYSIVPMVAFNFFAVIASNWLVKGEEFFINYTGIVIKLWVAILLFYGLKVIHDYKFFKTFGVIILTFVGMGIILFLIALFMQMTQQLFGFFNLLYSEFLLRLN